MNQLPEAFIREIQALLGEAASVSFFNALANEPVTSVRKNPFKPSGAFTQEQKVEWCETGRYLTQRPSFILDPLFHAGAYYVQESSSMFLHQVIKQIRSSYQQPLKILDLCAAPGGKSTLINSLLDKDDLLVSNEIIRSRVDILEENLLRWGEPNVLISNNDPKDFTSLQEYFDIIVVDAPCSGEGMFRKDKHAVEEWSPDNVQLCASRQQRILADVLPALKAGGFLIYSTCTFNTRENEDTIRWLITEHRLKPASIPVESNWPVTESEYGSFRFYPHKVKGEGLFLACLQKEEGQQTSQRFREQPLSFLHRKTLEEVKSWLKDPDDMDYIEWNKQVHAIRKNHIQDVKVLAKYLHLKNAGIRMGEIMKEKLLPTHHLALSNSVSSTVNKIEVTAEEALKYLKKDTLTLSQSYPQGIYLLTYEGLGIGWVKVLQNRINNYLPTHLRILKAIP